MDVEMRNKINYFMQIIKHQKFYLIISGIAVAASFLALLIWGLNRGIDFTGGSSEEFRFEQARPSNSEIFEVLKDLNPGNLSVNTAGEKGIILKFKDTDESKHQEVIKKLKDKYAGIGEVNFESIGPIIGKELARKSISALILVIAAIVLYIAWSFRKVSEPVASWKYGVAAIIALIHDISIVAGVFAVLGKFYGVEIGVPFIAALLTVLGYSVNDTIVVFDRTRENLARVSGKYEDIVNRSINEIFVRSINTSVTTFLALTAVFIFGGETTKYFMLALMIGVFVGTYSSIFVASPIVVIWEKLANKK